MFCPECGVRVDRDSRFCSECGATIEDDVTPDTPSSELRPTLPSVQPQPVPRRSVPPVAPRRERRPTQSRSAAAPPKRPPAPVDPLGVASVAASLLWIGGVGSLVGIGLGRSALRRSPDDGWARCGIAIGSTTLAISLGIAIALVLFV